MTKLPRPLATLAMLAAMAAACDDSTSPGNPEPTPAVVLFIGDGMGDGALKAARLSGRTLAMDALPVRRTVLTGSASHDITDSGAAATAYATGVATYNGAIGVDAAGVPVENVLEVAEERALATGLVATAAVTHATPAAFAAHVASRNDQFGIAVQMALSGVDVLLGGGHRYFVPEVRHDGLDLVGVFRGRGCAVWLVAAEVGSTDRPCALALLAEDRPPRAQQREPSLRSLTLVALEILSEAPGGFFLMVEGSQIDWAAHENDGAQLLAELSDFDSAVAAALEFLDGRSNTTVLVVSDHDTGGLSARWDEVGDSVLFEWSTTDHTAAPVRLFGTGGGIEILGDTVPNTAVGEFLLEAVRR